MQKHLQGPNFREAASDSDSLKRCCHEEYEIIERRSIHHKQEIRDVMKNLIDSLQK